MDKTERALRALFDYQRFEHNSRLDAIIKSVDDDIVPLDDNDLELSAAGESDIWRADKRDDKL